MSSLLTGSKDFEEIFRVKLFKPENQFFRRLSSFKRANFLHKANSSDNFRHVFNQSDG